MSASIQMAETPRCTQNSGGFDKEQSLADLCLEVSLFWEDSLLDVRHYVQPRSVTMGTVDKCDFKVISDLLPEDCYTFIRYHRGQYRLQFPRAFSGTVEMGGHRWQITDELLQTEQAGEDPHLLLHHRSQTIFSYGGLTWRLSFVEPPQAFSAPPQINYSWLNVSLISLFMHAAAIAFLLVYPTDLQAADFANRLSAPNRFTRFLVTQPKPTQTVKALLAPFTEKKSPDRTSRQNRPGRAGKPGKSGDPKASPGQRRGGSKNSGDDDKTKALNSFNRMFGSHGGGLEKAVEGVGGDLLNALSDVDGPKVGSSFGFGGLAMRGQGPGGAGVALVGYGAGTVVTKGGVFGAGSLCGGDRSGYCKRAKRAVVEHSTVLISSDGLDKALIRRYIREHTSQIRYCYERVLQNTPGLHGKVGVEFVIGSQGRVTKAKIGESTLGNVQVEQCIVGKVAGWRFPKPRGGGIVIIRYPFIFKAG